MNNFRELWFKDNIKWKNDDNLIEYNQIKSFKFLPLESNGKLRDQVTVPNIPMIVSCIQTPITAQFSNSVKRWGQK